MKYAISLFSLRLTQTISASDVHFSDVAQSCNIYSEYVSKAVSVPEQEHTYFGIAIYGSKKKVNKLTGFMPLLK
ncbi:DUF2000 family protein [Caproicibacterium sp. BJN0003]|uniref:DUF2000 family protein n=1 Tax=Caproicibacterium sp. BJN0003 TaxID=2994078 RepID=UPI003A4C62EB